MRVRAAVTVLAGEFASQPLAFAHLLDAHPRADLDQVEVVRRPFGPRLAHWFAPDAVRALEAVPEATLVLAFPGSGVPPAATSRLRVVGRPLGTLTRALEV